MFSRVHVVLAAVLGLRMHARCGRRRPDRVSKQTRRGRLSRSSRMVATLRLGRTGSQGKETSPSTAAGTCSERLLSRGQSRPAKPTNHITEYETNSQAAPIHCLSAQASPPATPRGSLFAVESRRVPVCSGQTVKRQRWLREVELRRTHHLLTVGRYLPIL